MTIGLLHSTIRGDEKLIIRAAQRRDIDLELIDVRTQIFNSDTYQPTVDIVLERSVSTVKGMHALDFFEQINIPTINTTSVARICEDKFVTSLVLQRARVPTLRTSMVFREEQAVAAIEELGGFPVVLKPTRGSWGRLIAKITDQSSLEAILEHKTMLGSPQHHAFYFQEYCEKPGRDIRAFVIGGETICAIYRTATHWITNTARGAQAEQCPVTPELSRLCKQASNAVGGGILAMDVFETDNGLTINEINHTMEFKNSEAPTGVSIADAILDYCLEVSS